MRTFILKGTASNTSNGIYPAISQVGSPIVFTPQIRFPPHSVALNKAVCSGGDFDPLTYTLKLHLFAYDVRSVLSATDKTLIHDIDFDGIDPFLYLVATITFSPPWNTSTFWNTTEPGSNISMWNADPESQFRNLEMFAAPNQNKNGVIYGIVENPVETNMTNPPQFRFYLTIVTP